ncbi:unnamed protein product [Lactuca saligna]|uniref:Uncharacterized protein n=1 Tax=Lactuca saligna TaxID=75948 RepID=A0AA36EMC9_LACSI|nr:unnamed protein product [Lactuca saligna]
MTEKIKFVDSHNFAGYLIYPPVAHQEFKSMMQSISYPEKDAAVTPPIATEWESDITMQYSILAPEKMDALIEELQQTTRKPPQTVPVITEPPSESDPDDSAYTLLLWKQKRRDRSELEKDNSDNDSKILELQVNLGGLTALFFDLKQCLYQKFGDEFQPFSTEGEKITASSLGPANPTSQSSRERSVRPALDATLYSFLSSGPISAQERREKQIRVEQLKGKMLVMKTSDQNAPGDHPEMFIRETRKKFIVKYGDHSGIMMWGYDGEKKMWTVMQKSGQIAFYNNKVDFLSWTKVDLLELIHLPFHNPTNDTIAWSFKNFLEIKAKNNFKDLKTASSFTKKAKGFIDPCTNKTLVIVTWARKQDKRIPLPKHLPKGTLDTIEFWVYDEPSASLKKNQFRIVGRKDLLKFGERDIHILSNFQIFIENELFEAVVKAFTGMVATIIDKKLWVREFDQENVHLIEKP